tara:strand:+ start:538 stop:804 length:267 start_codon:yes stop_codon:yes gene_type:complete
MYEQVNSVVDSFVSSCEGFAGDEMSMSPRPTKSILVFLLTLFIMLLILSFVGMLLWNKILVKLVPAIKPASNVFQILGLFLLMQFLFN